MSKTESKTSKITDSITTQNVEQTNLNKIQTHHNLKIKLQQSDNDITNFNKTEENLLNEKNTSENIYNNKKYQINKNENNLKDKNDGINTLKPEEKTVNINVKKKKVVKFLEPQFVEVIYVESYKKFNEENTSKDPYFGNENSKNENKTVLMCSCLIS